MKSLIRSFCQFSILFSINSCCLASPESRVLIWEDDFHEKELRRDLWQTYEGSRDAAILDSTAVKVQGSVLSLRSYSRDGRNLTGFIGSRENFHVLYGYIEARIRFFGVTGQHCAFWLQSPDIGRWIGDPGRSGTEVDIVEYRLFDRDGRSLDKEVGFNLHWDGYAVNHKTLGARWRSTEPIDKKWHVFSLERTPREYVFFVDGVERWRTTTAVSNVAQEVRFSCELGAGGGWSGSVPKEGYGERGQSSYGMDVDWVRVWSRR